MEHWWLAVQAANTAPTGKVADRHQLIYLISTLLAEALRRGSTYELAGATCVWCFDLRAADSAGASANMHQM